MYRQANSNAKLPLAWHSKIPRREPRGKNQWANRAFWQAQRAFRKHNWRIAREVPAIKIGD
jgi:hypothetical protein